MDPALEEELFGGYNAAVEELFGSYEGLKAAIASFKSSPRSPTTIIAVDMEDKQLSPIDCATKNSVQCPP